MPKPPSEPAPLWPVKLIDGQYYILAVEAFEFPSFCIILEREGKEPEILPAKTLEEAQKLLLSDYYSRMELENGNLKIYESNTTPFRLLSIENQDALRRGLNNYQVRQMKTEPVNPKYLLSYSSQAARLSLRRPPLKAFPQNDFLCFPYGEHKQVRANFHVQGKDLKELLLQIAGFEEILSLFFLSYGKGNAIPGSSPTYSDWTPVETSWGVQIRFIK